MHSVDTRELGQRQSALGRGRNSVRGDGVRRCSIEARASRIYDYWSDVLRLVVDLIDCGRRSVRVGVDAATVTGDPAKPACPPASLLAGRFLLVRSRYDRLSTSRRLPDEWCLMPDMEWDTLVYLALRWMATRSVQLELSLVGLVIEATTTGTGSGPPHWLPLRPPSLLWNDFKAMMLSRTCDPRIRTRTRTCKFVLGDPRGQGLFSRTTLLYSVFWADCI